MSPSQAMCRGPTWHVLPFSSLPPYGLTHCTLLLFLSLAVCTLLAYKYRTPPYGHPNHHHSSLRSSSPPPLIGSLRATLHRRRKRVREREGGRHGQAVLARRGGGVSFPRCWPLRRRRRVRRQRRELQLQRRGRLLGPMDQGQGHLVRPAQRRRPRRQRRCVRVQAHQPVPVHVDDLLRQPAIVQGRQGMRLLLQDQMHQGPVVLRQVGDGDHHRHELLPGGTLPLRPQRHGIRQARQAGAQRQAPPLRHHRHRVHQGAMRVPGAEDRVPRGGVLEPGVLRGAGGVRGRRRRRGAGGPDGVEDGARAADGEVDADEGVVGIHLEAGHQPQAPGPLLHPHPQRVRQDARRQERHPGQLEAQHFLPLLRPVQLNRRTPAMLLL